MPSTTLPDGTKIAWGRTVKNQGEITISYGIQFSTEPTIAVASEWVNNGVQHNDTVKTRDVSSFIIHGGNHAPNYFVNWIAIGR